MNLLDDTVTRDPIWTVSLARGDDGYSAMDTVQPHGWVPLPQWGSRGADLGTWPYVVVYIRWTDNAFDLAEYVEGDVRQWRLPTRERLDEALDELAALWTHDTTAERGQW
jgi:hypothetical protein